MLTDGLGLLGGTLLFIVFDIEAVFLYPWAVNFKLLGWFGYMTMALKVLLPTPFGELNLHRVEAACIPTNAPSIRVLEKCGFTREGLARRYLCINGVWQDHLLFGLLHEDFRG